MTLAPPLVHGRGARSEGPAPIDSATMRRKSGAKIREEQAVNRERMDHYRPPYVKPVGEDEKSRRVCLSPARAERTCVQGCCAVQGFLEVVLVVLHEEYKHVFGT